MNISLGITTWNSATWISKQLDEHNYFEMSDNLIDEIIIQDDCSPDYDLLQKYKTEKIKLYQNNKRLSPLLSRKNLVENCKNDWVLLMDSDNFLKKYSDNNVDCFKVIKNLPKNQNTIYCPGFLHHPSYVNICNNIYNFNDIKRVFNEHYIQTFLNTGNFLVPKKTYLEVCKDIDEKYLYYTVDVIYFLYLWLKKGNLIHCVGEYEYDHTICLDGFTCTDSNKSVDILQQVYKLFL